MMLKKIFLISAMLGLMVPTFAFAAFGLEGASQGTGLIGQGQTVSSDAVPNLIGSIVGTALSFVGAIFFLLILYAGFLWMTAFGNSEKVDKAKDILQHAAVGLLVVLAAYAISKFIFNSLTAATTATPANTGFSQCKEAKTKADCLAVQTGSSKTCNWDGTDCF